MQAMVQLFLMKLCRDHYKICLIHQFLSFTVVKSARQWIATVYHKQHICIPSRCNSQDVCVCVTRSVVQMALLGLSHQNMTYTFDKAILPSHVFKGTLPLQFSSVQLLSRVRLCDPMNHSTPGLPVHHQLLELTKISTNLSRA